MFQWWNMEPIIVLGREAYALKVRESHGVTWGPKRAGYLVEEHVGNRGHPTILLTYPAEDTILLSQISEIDAIDIKFCNSSTHLPGVNSSIFFFLAVCFFEPANPTNVVFVFKISYKICIKCI